MGIFVLARDMAKFGLSFLNDGEYEGHQVISANWVKDSLQRYSEGIKQGGELTSRYGSLNPYRASDGQAGIIFLPVSNDIRIRTDWILISQSATFSLIIARCLKRSCRRNCIRPPYGRI